MSPLLDSRSRSEPVAATLRRELGPGLVSVPEGAWKDLCRFDLGTPLAVVRASRESDVQTALSVARRVRTPVVAVGRRSAYWRPLHVEGAIALDLDGLRGLDLRDEVALVGAGTPVGLLDRALRRRGSCLPIHPDAYGATSIGAMAATACSSGIGMGNGAVSRWITGLRVVTGDSRLLCTGAAAFAGVPAFTRDGLPDPTGLFLAAEGALGVITHLALRLQRPPYRVRLRCRLEPGQALELAGIARELGQQGLYDTFRALWEREGQRDSGLALDVWVQSFWSPREAMARARYVQARLAGLGAAPTLDPETERARRGRDPEYSRRWPGPPGEQERFAQRTHFVGMDVNAPYRALEGLWPLARRAAHEQAVHGASQVRTALYFAPDFVNLGLHASFPPRPGTVAWTREHLERWLAELATHPVMPYRLGRLWPKRMRNRLQPQYRDCLLGLKRLLDPGSLLNPGHPLFSPEAS